MLGLKKHIALLSILILFIPLGIQIEHLFEDHSHELCTSVVDHHFHEQEVDCSQYHFQFETFTYNATTSYEVIPQHIYKTSYSEDTLSKEEVFTNKKSSRAPPSYVIIA